MITLENIRTKLIDAINQSGMSQTTLAKELNIRQQTISEYLHGKSMPALDTLANLCIILNIEPNEILCYRNEVPKKNVQINTKYYKCKF